MEQRGLLHFFTCPWPLPQMKHVPEKMTHSSHRNLKLGSSMMPRQSKWKEFIQWPLHMSRSLPSQSQIEQTATLGSALVVLSLLFFRSLFPVADEEPRPLEEVAAASSLVDSKSAEAVDSSELWVAREVAGLAVEISLLKAVVPLITPPSTLRVAELRLVLSAVVVVVVAVVVAEMVAIGKEYLELALRTLFVDVMVPLAPAASPVAGSELDNFRFLEVEPPPSSPPPSSSGTACLLSTSSGEETKLEAEPPELELILCRLFLKDCGPLPAS